MDAIFGNCAPQSVSQDHVDDLCGLLLASVPRSDQRRWGELYVRGLLRTQGRKTIQGIAAAEGSAAMQSLQQFISTSPWQWKPVRQSLARHLDREIRPAAWVVEPLTVLKAGRHSVGVERQFVPGLGRMANCQQSTSVWLAAERASCPVDWQLALPVGWVADREQRRRAAIPEHARALTPVQCSVEAVLTMAEDWGLPARPVVMAVPGPDVFEVTAAFTARRIPFVLRIDGTLPVVESAGGTRVLPASRLIGALRERAGVVDWRDLGGLVQRSARVVGVRVGLPAPADRAGGWTGLRPYLLVGAWSDPLSARPTEFWLSNLGHLPTATVLRTAKLARRVSRDLFEVGDRVGARDFAGRTFRGWHHHATLVSIAHAVCVLARQGRPGYPPLPVHRTLVGAR
ncbi:IS701 family transposase [Kitasatospora sp. LaBMicrA B282]|uniref:IS701 family transposase n=1 Tax=Kitasatospora sp. LaBMicrA B282 TaxID=3420949 RepID=UPI003D0B4EF2